MSKGTLSVVLFVLAGFGLLAASCSDNDPAGPHSNPPVLADLQDTTITVGSTLHLTASASDRDGDPISYHLTIMIRGIHDPLPDAHIDSDTGEFVFQPTASDRPNRDFVVRARDGRGGEDATSFTVIVN